MPKVSSLEFPVKQDKSVVAEKISSESKLYIDEVEYLFTNPFISLSAHDLRTCGHIGSGGSGEVYSAYFKTDPKRLLAVKIFEPTFSHSHILSEIAVWRTLNNYDEQINSLRNITFHNSPLVCAFVVSLKSFNETKKIYFMVTALGECGTLRLLRVRDNRMRPFCIEEIQWFAIQLLHIIKAYHAKCYVHGDLKPQNIIVNRNGYLKLIDYGSTSDSLLNESPKTLGTLGYTPPETADGYRANCKVKFCGTVMDYWGIGAILFKLLTTERLVNLHWPSDQSAINKLKVKRDERLRCYLYSDMVAIDFFKKLLDFNPETRASSSILEHKFLEKYSDMRKETDIKNFKMPSSLQRDLDEKFHETEKATLKGEHLNLNELSTISHVTITAITITTTTIRRTTIFSNIFIYFEVINGK
ncbi:hypothetical protein SNEBB_004128 [Seison nebaliae]|nr:hypothetical protein SNEBB_004128 [Seison nebaliae]